MSSLVIPTTLKGSSYSHLYLSEQVQKDVLPKIVKIRISPQAGSKLGLFSCTLPHNSNPEESRRHPCHIGKPESSHGRVSPLLHLPSGKPVLEPERVLKDLLKIFPASGVCDLKLPGSKCLSSKN